MTLVAFETTWDADNNRIGRAVVCDTDSLQVGIACARVGDSPSAWEPLYLMTADGGQRDLPACFSLNTAAIAALNLMTIRDRNP